MSLRQKKSPDSTAAEATPTSTISGLLAAAVDAVDVDAEEVKVNNASTTEMKHACDDALKRVSAASFTVLLNVISLCYERKHEA